jgi:adenylosuccinate lyase
VEVEYLLSLASLQLKGFEALDDNKIKSIKRIADGFDLKAATRVKEIEKNTNHDIKALEYYIKEEMDKAGLGEIKEFTHFGLTSQDVNNTAFPMMMRDGLAKTYMPLLNGILQKLESLENDWYGIAMLAHTHGQPASPTRLGKEARVFGERLEKQSAELKQYRHSCKFGGATGNFNAHYAAYPDVDWKAFADAFAKEKLGLERQQTTTQIEHYDGLASLFDLLKRINTILIDLARDMWTYISMDYFGQAIKKGEVGSSAMPHKVNPIDFENSEGNLGLANALFTHLSAKLPVSRLQRDLTDSTVIRNIGVPLAHSTIGMQSLMKGLGKLKVNREKIEQDLEENWIVIAEAIQTILRREGYPKPYEALKELTRTGKKISKKAIRGFIDQLDINDTVKTELKSLSPFNYTGKA